MKKDVRILLVGDPGVGKTSLILSLVSEEFPEDVPPRAEEITIPADVTPEKVPTHIVDFSTTEQTDEQLDEAIMKANVICVVYDVTQEETINRITSFWLPRLSEVYVNNEKPVILVGNKSDLSDETTIETVLPIMNEYTEVETCVECSAKTLKNISETFYYAQKAVLHPTAPLYSPEEKELKPACVNALTRIFKICDVDNDGILSDTELNEFQCRCFKAPLQPQGLLEVKNVVRRNLPEEGIIDDGLSIQGFLFLHKLFIQRGRHETTWTALRKFGYGEDLDLRKDYMCPGIEVGSDCTTELTDQGYEFLIDIFSRHDKDGDEALSPTELENLFSICPSVPWDEKVLSSAKTSDEGWITLEGFLAQWALTTYLDYQKTLAYLAYFGYTHGQNEYPLTSAITVTRSKAMDLQKKQTTRTVFQCLVVGPQGVGKTRFLQTFLGRNIEECDPESELPKFTINLVTVHRQEKYLVLHEVDWFNVEEVLEAGHCDVVCFLYDSTDPHSFARVIRLHEILPDRIPALFVSTKNDLVPVKQESDISPAEYCSLHNIPPPQAISVSTTSMSGSDNKHIFTKLAAMAVYPNLCGTNSSYGLMPSSWVAVGVGAAAVLVACFVAYRYVKQSGS